MLNNQNIERARQLRAKGFTYSDIAILNNTTADAVYFAIHGRKPPKARGQTPSDAVAELLADGCDPAIVAANFGEVA